MFCVVVVVVVVVVGIWVRGFRVCVWLFVVVVMIRWEERRGGGGGKNRTGWSLLRCDARAANLINILSLTPHAPSFPYY